MSAPGFDNDIENFLLAHITSVEQLEILFIVRKSFPQSWSVAALTSSLRSAQTTVTGHCERLRHMGLFEKLEENDESVYKYNPHTAPAGDLVDRLEHEYALRRTRIIEFIYSNKNRVINDFANAFIFKKGK